MEMVGRILFGDYGWEFKAVNFSRWQLQNWSTMPDGIVLQEDPDEIAKLPLVVCSCDPTPTGVLVDRFAGSASCVRTAAEYRKCPKNWNTTYSSVAWACRRGYHGLGFYHDGNEDSFFINDNWSEDPADFDSRIAYLVAAGQKPIIFHGIAP